MKVSRVEENDSRIKWEKADPVTAKKLAAAMIKHNQRQSVVKAPRILLFLPAVVLLVILTGALFMAQNSDKPLVIIVPSVVSTIFFVVILLIQYAKFRAYLYPEKQADIWTFRAKCLETNRGSYDLRDWYSAYFQKGGVIISIPVTAWEYKMYTTGEKKLTGREYIFYKFKDETGLPWKAFPAELLTEQFYDCSCT